MQASFAVNVKAVEAVTTLVQVVEVGEKVIAVGTATPLHQNSGVMVLSVPATGCAVLEIVNVLL